MDITSFTTKYDKISGNIYSVEEQVTMPDDGVYEAYLEHDNVDDDTLLVYTGASQTGTKLSYSLTVPDDLTWKRKITIETTDYSVVYITYECEGDQAEASDINDLQDAINQVQTAINELSEEVRGTVTGYTWDRLAGVVSSSTLSITTQPVNNTIAVGDDAEFSIVAEGDDITYRWQYKLSTDSTWSDFDDGDSDVLTFTVEDETWNRCNIRCILTDGDGDVLISETVLLYVTD